VRFSKWTSRREKIRTLRKALVDDSIEREKDMKLLLELVREDEREKTLADLEGARAKAERSER